jgi:hypothetical protein
LIGADLIGSDFANRWANLELIHEQEMQCRQQAGSELLAVGVLLRKSVLPIFSSTVHSMGEILGISPNEQRFR